MHRYQPEAQARDSLSLACASGWYLWQCRSPKQVHKLSPHQNHPGWRYPMSSPEKRLQELGIILPTPPKPVAKYKPPVLIGNVLYVSGHGPAKSGDAKLLAGKVGAKLNVEEGKESAKLVGINILATVKATLGSLDRVKRLIKTLGMVNAAPDFLEHPQV